MSDETVIRKEAADCYFLPSERGEGWAHIYLTEGVRKTGSRWGEIAIVSDYGVFGHTWTAIGDRSFRDFLSGLGRDYVLDKLGRTRFNVEGSRAMALRKILARRRADEIDADEAREMHDHVSDIYAETADGWQAALVEALGARWSAWEAWDWIADDEFTPDSRALWDHVWPRMVAQFRDESNPSPTSRPEERTADA